MKKTITLSVPTPCHENWENFTPTRKGGFCDACQKEVIDFTRWTDDEIKAYFQNRGAFTCGRFKMDQLKTYNATAVSTWHSPWAALVAFVLLLANDPAAAQSPTVATHEKVKEPQGQPDADTRTRVLTISGVVLDVDSIELPGVNVLRKGFPTGTVTDADGRFALKITAPQAYETLVVSFIGLKTVEIGIQPHQDLHHLKIVMVPDEEALLGEVVVGGAVAVRRYSPRGLWWKLKGLFR